MRTEQGRDNKAGIPDRNYFSNYYIIKEDGTILQKEVCTKIPNVGTNYEYALSLELGNLYNYWREIIAYDVKAYTITRYDQDTTAQPESLKQPHHINYKISLPEHYTSITMDNSHPTDLTGFIRNDTIIINFKNY
ncbi:MAG: hypothetical protein V4547_18040 [Bacteroidota bacterium]